MAWTVLVVDDHAEFRGVVRAWLESEGFRVVGEASDAREALTMARLTEATLVVLDIRLTGRDGISVAEELATWPRPPQVVLVSSRPAAAYGRRLRDAPVLGFVAKDALSAASLRRLLPAAQ